MPRLRHLVVTASLFASVTLAVLTTATHAHAELPGVTQVTRVLDVLGLIEKDAPKITFTRAVERTPTWLSPEPPKTPLLYSSLVVAKF